MSNPFYQDHDTTLYNGDCLDILPKITNIDILITDPPFNIGKKYDEYDDSLPENEYWTWYEKWLKATFKVLNDQAIAYIFCLPIQSNNIKEIAEFVGFKFVQYIVWYRPNLLGGTKRISWPWTPMYEQIVMLWKGKRQPMLRGSIYMGTVDVLIVPAPQSNFNTDRRLHITQKPLKLIKMLIARTPGKKILDNFSGAGTTLIGARDLNRESIGIEISEKSCQIALRRLNIDQQRINL